MSNDEGKWNVGLFMVKEHSLEVEICYHFTRCFRKRSQSWSPRLEKDKLALEVVHRRLT